MTTLQFAGLILNLWIIAVVVVDNPIAKIVMWVWTGVVLLLLVKGATS